VTAHDPGETFVAASDTELSGDIDEHRSAVPRLARATADGYRSSSPAERAAFGMISGFALSLAGARKITYIQERRRNLPGVRGLGRAIPRLPGSDDIRVHHYLPGMTIAMATGGAAILAGPGGIERWLSAPFGVGVGLVVDEIGLLTGRNNPYWGSERFVLITCVTAASAAAAMAAVFLRRGRRTAIDPI
jgi:hypothetical protein